MDTADEVHADVDRDVAFDAFVRSSEQRLRIALTAAYGPVDGPAAALDALSWGWEHWDRLHPMLNPVGYLFRVGQTAARRLRSKPLPFDAQCAHVEAPDVAPELLRAVAQLSEQQRLAVLLVHAFGWTVRDAAQVLDVAPSTLQTHAERALARLRQTLEVDDAGDH